MKRPVSWTACYGIATRCSAVRHSSRSHVMDLCQSQFLVAAVNPCNDFPIGCLDGH